MYDVVIIGGGAAGLTAGIYSARAGLKTLIIEHKFTGGQTATTSSVENYPGVANANGAVLCDVMKKQALTFGAELLMKSPAEIDFERKTIKLSDGEIGYRALILCMGAKNRKLGVEKEDLLAGAGVSYCATCDGNFFRGKEVAVVGGGNTALEDAIYLSRICNTVYLVHRREEFRGSKVLVDEIKNIPNIKLKLNKTVSALNPEGFTLGSVDLFDVNTEQTCRINVSGLFIAVGTYADTALVKEKIELDESGSIVVDKYMKTSLEGVFAAGDVTDTPLKQIVTAAANGAIAAASAEKYLSVKK